MTSYTLLNHHIILYHLTIVTTIYAYSIFLISVIKRLQLEENRFTTGPSSSNSNEIKGLKVFLGDFDRPNLIFEVMPKSSNFREVIATIVQHLPPPLGFSSSGTSTYSRDTYSSSYSSSNINTNSSNSSSSSGTNITISSGSTNTSGRSNGLGISEHNDTVASHQPVVPVVIQAGNAIVYCFSQKECVTVSNALTELGNNYTLYCPLLFIYCIAIVHSTYHALATPVICYYFLFAALFICVFITVLIIGLYVVILLVSLWVFVCLSVCS
jgi:hypothetical protein